MVLPKRLTYRSHNYIVQMVQCIYALLTIHVAVRTSTHNSFDFNIYYSSNIALQIMKLYNFRKINILYYRLAVCIIIIIVNFINIYDIYKKLSTLFATFFFTHLLYHLIHVSSFLSEGSRALVNLHTHMMRVG